jgi:hypothetical protein
VQLLLRNLPKPKTQQKQSARQALGLMCRPGKQTSTQ